MTIIIVMSIAILALAVGGIAYDIIVFGREDWDE